MNRFSYTFKIILQDYVNLEIKKKSGLSLNPDIYHSKVPGSGEVIFLLVLFSLIFTTVRLKTDGQEDMPIRPTAVIGQMLQ